VCLASSVFLLGCGGTEAPANGGSGGFPGNSAGAGGAVSGGAPSSGGSNAGAQGGVSGLGGANGGRDGKAGAAGLGGSVSGGAGATASGGTGGGPSTQGGAPGQGGTSTGGVTSAGSGGAGAPAGGGAGANAAGGGVGGASEGGSAGSGGSAANDLCEVGKASGGANVPLTLSGNTFAHDPTMIKVGDTYYRFWTGERIQRSTSDDLLRWANTSTVYSAYPAWVDTWLNGVAGETFNFPWAPDVSSFGGLVHLYSSFSAKFGDNISCITHLTTDDIAGNRWTDHGPVICTEGNENFNAIDADVGFDTEGNPYFSFGSFWDGIFAFPLNPDGSRKGTETTRLAWASQIEAPVLFYRCGYYYLFVTWGLCCPGEGRSVNDLTYRVAVGRSENILGPYLDKTGKTMVSGGGTLVVEGDGAQWAAAGHSDVLVDGDRIYHTYHAYAQSSGSASLRIVELEFDAEGWPVPHAP
jgi:arabinan endo-1,5-alpha-L-arabinosidase